LPGAWLRLVRVTFRPPREEPGRIKPADYAALQGTSLAEELGAEGRQAEGETMATH